MKRYSSVDRFYKLHELFTVDFKKSEQDAQIVHKDSNGARLTEIDSSFTA